MDIKIRIDEGHFLSDEDHIFNIKWKVNDLMSQGYTENDILYWEYNETWNCYSKIFLDQLK